MIKMNDCLSVLFINWNLILSKGGLLIWKEIEKNGKLQVFDISFNNIGSKTDTKLAETLKILFLTNSTLIHIDISHWKLTTQELKIINEGLTHNHSILGIHMVGNKGKIDTLGFIDADHDEDTAITHIATRLSPELNTGRIRSKAKIQLRAWSNWWIWEGWLSVPIFLTFSSNFFDFQFQFFWLSVPIFLTFCFNFFDFLFQFFWLSVPIILTDTVLTFLEKFPHRAFFYRSKIWVDSRCLFKNSS